MRNTVVLALLLASACMREKPADTAALVDSGAVAASVPAADTAPSLAGTSWQLVQFQGGDDKTLTPSDPSRYTVMFGTDGRVAVLGDCNRGSGTWTSEGPSQVSFGPLATTRAMCPPGSMSERYLRDFSYMRSYVIKDGHLFISLMADGGIYEFAPITT